MNHRFRWVHAGFLLVMIPLGLHWVPQNSLVRVVSGFLFGAATIAFLSLPFAMSWNPLRWTTPSYILCLALGFGLTWVGSVYGNPTAARVISLLSAAGAAGILVTLAMNLGYQSRCLRFRRTAHLQ